MKKNEGEIKLENKLYSKVFMWLFIGLLITFGGAMALLAAPSVCKFILGSNIYYAIFIAEIIIAIFLGSRITTMKPTTTKILYCLYALFTGITFASLFLIFKITSIIVVFLITAVIFGIFALLGKFTKVDLSKFGTYLMIGLISVILLELVNIFVASNSLDMFLCIITIIIFIGYTAFDMQNIARMANMGIDDDNYAIIGAFRLYLDFVNLFIKLLNIFGKDND